jgi:hypothetical protein
VNRRYAVAFACFVPVPVFAHAGEPLRPDDLWSAWEFDPGIVALLGVAAVLYAIGSSRHFGLTRFQRTCFWLGWLSLMLALSRLCTRLVRFFSART